MKYRLKTSLIEATQWISSGDHPEVQDFHSATDIPGMDSPEDIFCSQCGNRMYKHGILDGLNGEETICPGDYIVTDANELHYRLSRGEFESQYELWAPPPRNKKALPVSDLEERLQRRKDRRL